MHGERLDHRKNASFLAIECTHPLVIVVNLDLHVPGRDVTMVVPLHRLIIGSFTDFTIQSMSMGLWQLAGVWYTQHQRTSRALLCSIHHAVM